MVLVLSINSVNLQVDGRNKLDPEDNRPGMDVKIDAEKMLNVTVTKSFLALLTKLGEVRSFVDSLFLFDSI